MKKIFLLVITLLSQSCDRDGSEPSDEGLIVGVWQNFGESKVNLDGTFGGLGRVCKQVDPFNMIVRLDGTIFYYESELVDEETCLQVSHRSLEGTWERLGNEKYRFVFQSTEIAGEEVLEPYKIRIGGENNNQMFIQWDPVFDNGIDTPYYYESFYVRQMATGGK